MKSVKVYEEGGKYYVSADLADLPSGFYWQPGFDVMKSDATYITTGFVNDIVGDTGKVVYELTGVTKAHIQAGADVRFSAEVITENVMSGSVIMAVDSSMSSKVYSVCSQGNNSEWINFNTSTIFAGWK